MGSSLGEHARREIQLTAGRRQLAAGGQRSEIRSQKLENKG